MRLSALSGWSGQHVVSLRAIHPPFILSRHIISVVSTLTPYFSFSSVVSCVGKKEVLYGKSMPCFWVCGVKLCNRASINVADCRQSVYLFLFLLDCRHAHHEGKVRRQKFPLTDVGRNTFGQPRAKAPKRFRHATMSV